MTAEEQEQDRIVNYVNERVDYYEKLGYKSLMKIKDEPRDKYDEFSFKTALFKLENRSSLAKRLARHSEVKNYKEYIDDKRIAVYFEVHSQEIIPVVHRSADLDNDALKELFYDEVYRTFKRNLPHYLKTLSNQPES